MYRLLYFICAMLILSISACSSDNKQTSASPTTINWTSFFVGQTWISEHTVRVKIATGWDENLNAILQEVDKPYEYNIFTDNTLSIIIPRTFGDSTTNFCIADWTLSDTVLRVNWDAYLPQPCQGIQTAQLSALADGKLRISSVSGGSGEGLVEGTFHK